MNEGDDTRRIFELWHEYASTGNVDALVDLYAADAVLETPLVPAIYDGRESGVLRGRAEIEDFLREGTRRRPNELVRWFRSGAYLANGGMLAWEYPRQTPNGDQVDLVEFMDIEDGRIKAHRIYWGWFGFKLLLSSAMKKAGAGP